MLIHGALVYIIPREHIFHFNSVSFHRAIYKFWITAWKYNGRRNVNLELPIVTMRRVEITFFELGAVKNLMQKFV